MHCILGKINSVDAVSMLPDAILSSTIAPTHTNYAQTLEMATEATKGGRKRKLADESAPSSSLSKLLKSSDSKDSADAKHAADSSSSASAHASTDAAPPSSVRLHAISSFTYEANKRNEDRAVADAKSNSNCSFFGVFDGATLR